MSNKRKELINDYLSSPIKVGDSVKVPIGKVKTWAVHPERLDTFKVIAISGNQIRVKNDDTEGIVDIVDVKKDTRFVGANPFSEEAWRGRTHTINYPIGSLMHSLFPELSDDRGQRFEKWKINGIPVKETNFNPYVIDKNGEKHYYQRPFVWTLEEKQLLIESIYKRISCGQILVRSHSYKEVERRMNEGDTEICFRDIVDGKQRLNALYEFMTDKFPDLHGNYFSDLSDYAQWEFEDMLSFSYADMDEGTTDEDVIAAFLNVNFTGVPQSKEHIEYVEKIAKLMK